MRHYSRQRQAILEVIRSTDTHPTADWIYAEARKIIPNISLGTVYRNLSSLSQDGEILCIDVSDGKEHYDGDNSPHLHLSCRECGKITDARLEHSPFKHLEEHYGFTPETPVYVVYGHCKNCKNKA